MASPDLIPYEYRYRQVDLVGTTILVDKTTQTVAVDNTASQVVLGPFDTSALSAAPYGYHTDYPLMLKLFCDTVVTDTTGEYEIKVTGSLGSTTARRQDDKKFGMTWKIRDWVSLTDADATVTITPFSPLTSVSMNCTCGLATDYIDRKSEGSYA